ncbi:MAG TPA: ribokinase [Gaiellaceae bacterium]
MPPELTVVGSLNVDLVARVERLPRPGETLTGAEFARYPGGKGANQAVAAARLGADVRLVCAAGDDFPDITEPGLQTDVQLTDSPTGVALILVDAAGENVIVVAPGANARLEPPEELGGAVLCQLEIPLAVVEDAARRADRFFLNAAPARELRAEVVERAEIVVVNRLELEGLPVAPRLTALTLGPEGAVLLDDGREVARARPPEVTAVDGTAAGDAFTACLVVSLLEGRDRQESLVRACAAGALAASRPGAQPSLPTADEVDAILAS